MKTWEIALIGIIAVAAIGGVTYYEFFYKKTTGGGGGGGTSGVSPTITVTIT